jgi:hypothetical protein
MTDQTGFGFYYQPRFNPGVDALYDRRAEMGVRTFVNTIETLANPANADVHLGSFYHLAFAKRIVDTFGEMERQSVDRVIMFQGLEGYDDIRPGSTVVAEYDATNPDVTGADDVSVALNDGAYTETGTVVYGPAGDGTLGYGLDLRLSAIDGSPEITAPLAATTVEYDRETNELVARTTTDELALEEYTVNLTVRESSPFVDQRTTMSEQFRVESPDATFTDMSETDTGLAVTAETNLAPGTNLTITVTGLGRDYATSARTTVGDDGTFGVDVDLSEAPNESRFTASIDQIANSRTVLTTGSAEATTVLFERYESPSSSDADAVENARVALEDGGFLAVYLVPPDARLTRADLIGRSGSLPPGVHDPAVSLDRPLTDSRNVVPVAHRDGDGDERFDYPADDSPYRIGGDPVYGLGTVVLDGDASTPPIR